MTRKGLILGILSAFAFIGIYWLVLRSMASDNAIQLQEILGLFFLTLIALGSIVILVGRSAGEILFLVMESIGDINNQNGKTRVARLWYQRCIRLDDSFLDNTGRRVLVMGKLSKIYDHDGHPELVHQLKLRKNKALKKKKFACRHSRPTIQDSVEDSFIYRYIFVILFGALAIVYSINASAQMAALIFVFGIGLNGYWLHKSQDDAVS